MNSDQQASQLCLPAPEEVALSLSEDLREKISFAIMENGGSISFEQYMQMALYEPGLGYYSAGSSKFGPQGDFVTAPEIISYLFSLSCESVPAGIIRNCLRLYPRTRSWYWCHGDRHLAGA